MDMYAALLLTLAIVIVLAARCATILRPLTVEDES